jgi:hypothetical protein
MPSPVFTTPPPKPFLDVLAEDPRYDANQGLLDNIAGNVYRGADKVMRRNMYRNRAQQMNAALADWDKQQAINRQRMGMQKVAAGLMQGLGQAARRFGPMIGKTLAGAGLGAGAGEAEIRSGLVDPSQVPGGRWSVLGGQALAGAGIANAGLPSAAAWRRAGRGAFSAPAIRQTALGGLAGAGLGAGEIASGWADPNMSNEGKATVMGLNTLGGMALGNPYFRQRMFMMPKTKLTGVGGLAPVGKTMTQIRPWRTLGAASVGLGVPKLVNLGDTTAKFSRMAQKAFQDPKTQAMIEDPVGYGTNVARDAAANAAREFGKSEAAQAGMSTLANTLGAGVGGSLVGGAAGHLLGGLFAGDDEGMTYEQRRGREAIRNMLGWGGTIAGGFAAPYFVSKYAPNLIPSIVSRATGGTAPISMQTPAQAAAAAPAPAPPVNPTAGK